MNGQIVLCKGVNDKDELKRSIEDLSNYLPFMRSVSVVPAGLTKYREGLYPLELFSKEEAGEVIDMIESYQPKFYEEYGLHFIQASDEWYILAERDFPEEERYDGYIQLENGVGMLRLLEDEVAEELSKREGDDRHRHVTIATGKAAAPSLEKHMQKIREKYPNVQAEVITIINYFFGRIHYRIRSDYRKGSDGAVRGKRSWRLPAASVQHAPFGKKRLSRRCDGGRGGRAPENTGTDYR
mgnify:CR=1 FL=1